jgi:hypothetical protein
MSDYRTNFFGTFLDTMNTSVSGSKTSDQPPKSPSLADSIIRLLGSQHGRAEVKDLLPLAAYSADQIITVINSLESFGLVKRTDNFVMLTETGWNVAKGA